MMNEFNPDGKDIRFIDSHYSIITNWNAWHSDWMSLICHSENIRAV